MLFDKTTPYQTVKTALQNIPEPRDRALFCTQYACYARIGEIVNGRHSKNPPISKNRIQLEKKRLKLQVLTEKVHNWRKIVVSRTKEEWLVNIVWNYAQNHPSDELFQISTRRAQKLFSKHFETFKGENTHLIRHWAITHALQQHRSVKPVDSLIVARQAGINDLKTLQTYLHLVVEDYEDAF